MSATKRSKTFTRSGFAGLDFIKAAACPLKFKVAGTLKDHPNFQHLGKDDLLAQLQIGEPLYFPRQFPYRDTHGNSKKGTQIVTSAYGLSPVDIHVLFGLYTYLRGKFVEDGTLPRESKLTVNFIAELCSLPATRPSDYQEIRSRLFRLSHTKMDNTAFWYADLQVYDFAQCSFFDIVSLSQLVTSKRPITFRWHDSFLEKIQKGRFLEFDLEFLRSLSPSMGRLYLLANYVNWNQKHSPQYLVEDFMIHQLGFSNDADLNDLEDTKQRQRLKQKRQHERHRMHQDLLKKAEDLGIIIPFESWGSYYRAIPRGPRRGQLGFRWTRGPQLHFRQTKLPGGLANDELYAQVKELHDKEGKPIHPKAYQRLLAEYGKDRLQNHVDILLATRDMYPGRITNEVGAFVDAVKKNYAAPQWYEDMNRAQNSGKRLSPFAEVQPNQLTLDIYGNFFQD